MRVVAVSMVKDEADVVEAFVRHTLAFADHHVVFDHGSSDATPALLDRLRREGHPLTILADDIPAYAQSERTTALARYAIRELGADWVVPLDADEFVQAASPAAVRQILDGEAGGAIPFLPLKNYVCGPDDDRAEPNPVLRMTRRDPTVVTGKVVVRVAEFDDPSARLMTGNHGVVRPEGERALAPSADLWLAHYPVRSAAQRAKKVANQHLQKLSGGIPHGAEQYAEPFARLLANPARFLATADEAHVRFDRRPAAYWGESVRYPVSPMTLSDVTKTILATSESIAEAYGRERTLANDGWRGRLRFLIRPRPAAPLWTGERFRPAPPPPDSTQAEGLAASLTDAIIRVANDEWFVTVTVTNSGPAIWRSRHGVGMVRLGVQIPNDRDYGRCELPHDLEPGESLTLAMKCPRPHERGRVVLDMVSEGVTWFECGVTPNVIHAESKRAA